MKLDVLAAGVDDPVFAHAGFVIRVAQVLFVFLDGAVADDFEQPVGGAFDFDFIARLVRDIAHFTAFETLPKYADHVRILRQIGFNVGDEYAESGLPTTHMGREITDDPLFFAAALASGDALAAATLAEVTA